MSHGDLLLLRDRASQPVLEDIARDQERVRGDLWTLLAYLRANLFDIDPKTHAWLAACGFEGRDITSRFYRVFRWPLPRYVQWRRCQVAATLLDDTDLPPRDIAVLLGFGSAKAFTDFFQRIFGLSPRSYRAAQRQQSRRKGEP